MSTVTVVAAPSPAPFVDVRDYDAVGDGVTNDTTAIQNAINACPVGGTVFLPLGTYKITAALTISTPLTLRGEGIAELEGTVVNNGGNGPLVSPYLQGTVILQATAGANGINITGTGIQVNLYDFGIRFADGIKFSNTGHGIYSVPSASAGSGHESGLMNGRWDNVQVFGHDGNHYAFYFLNSNLGTFTHLRGYGGGGIYIECDSYYSIYGNALFLHPYFVTYCGGSAHGYHLKGRALASTGGLNLIHFVRPQCNIIPVPPAFSGLGISAATNAQYLWKTTGNVQSCRVDAPDLEGSFSNTADFGPLFTGATGGGTLVTTGGFLPQNTLYASLPATRQAPVITPGVGLGTGGSAGVSGVGDDRQGVLALNVGTSPGARLTDILTFTWSSFSKAKTVQLTPFATEYAGGVRFYPAALTDSGFTLRADVALTASGGYQIGYSIFPLNP